MQHADGIDFVSTSHDFLEDAMTVLQTLSSPNTVWCATQTRLRGRTCLKDRIGKEQYSWCTLGGRARRASQVMQLANLAFWCMCGLFSGVTASLELKIRVPHREVRVWSATQRGQTSTTLWQWTWGLTTTMAEKLCISLLTSPNPCKLLLAKVNKQ